MNDENEYEWVLFYCPACDEEYRMPEDAEECVFCGNEKIESMQ